MVKNMEDFVTRVEHTEFAKRIDEENDRQNHRLTVLEKAVEGITGITVNIEKLAISMETMTKELEKQGKRLDAIEDTPKKRWETIVAAIIAGLVGFLLNAIIMGAIK